MDVDTQLIIEILKLIVSFSTPLLVVILGIFVSRHLKAIETRAASNQALLKRRLEFYDSVSKPLDSLFCFSVYVGTWRTPTPPEMIETKRELDSAFHRAIPYLSRETFAAYQALHDVCFLSQRGKGTSGQLRANVAMHREGRRYDWDDNWETMFVPEAERSKRTDVFKAYAKLVASISVELGAGDKTSLLQDKAQRLRINIASSQL